MSNKLYNQGGYSTRENLIFLFQLICFLFLIGIALFYGYRHFNGSSSQKNGKDIEYVERIPESESHLDQQQITHDQVTKTKPKVEELIDQNSYFASNEKTRLVEAVKCLRRKTIGQISNKNEQGAKVENQVVSTKKFLNETFPLLIDGIESLDSIKVILLKTFGSSDKNDALNLIECLKNI